MKHSRPRPTENPDPVFVFIYFRATRHCGGELTVSHSSFVVQFDVILLEEAPLESGNSSLGTTCRNQDSLMNSVLYDVGVT